MVEENLVTTESNHSIQDVEDKNSDTFNTANESLNEQTEFTFGKCQKKEQATSPILSLNQTSNNSFPTKDKQVYINNIKEKDQELNQIKQANNDLNQKNEELYNQIAQMQAQLGQKVEIDQKNEELTNKITLMEHQILEKEQNDKKKIEELE